MPSLKSSLRSAPGPRRREVRRHMPRGGPAWWRGPRRREMGWAGLFTLMFAGLATLIALSATLTPRYHVGHRVEAPLVARAGFGMVDEDLTGRARDAARALVPPHFVADTTYLDELRSRLGALLSLTDEPFDGLAADVRRDFELTRAAYEALSEFPAAADWEARVEVVLDRFFDQPILDLQDFPSARDSPTGIMAVRPPAPDPAASGGGATQVTRRDRFHYPAFRSMDEPEAIASQIRQVVAPLPVALRAIAARVIRDDLRPTYVPEPNLTAEARATAAAETQPARIRFEPGELLVAAGHILTAEDLQLLSAEAEAVRARRATGTRLTAGLGQGAIFVLLGLAGWVFLFQTSRRIVRNPIRGFALTLLLIVGQALAVVLAGFFPGLGGALTFPTLLVAMILAVVYDRALALALGVLHAVVVALTLGPLLDDSLGWLVIMVTGAAAAVLQLREVRTRSKLVGVGATAGAAMFVAAFAVAVATRPESLLDASRIPGLFASAAAAGLAGLAAGIILQSMLPLIERLFRVTTALTLKELNDHGRPLLQRLAHEAPGTHQHSLRIADMAEAAAEAIGADGLLCRVGAMYHDIGKINKPQYFIENQGGGPNRHNSLSPAMSLLIIVGHVKDGIEMAREYNLPRSVVHFIESHHGTSLVEYFYHAACRSKDGTEDAAPSEFEYRYPGPKPRTREAAILLICDGIEGAARAMGEPTPARLKQITHKMVVKRLTDGQFDECPLTFADLSRIESAIVKTLSAIYHPRIKYPAADAGEPLAPGVAAAAQ